jgi:hypothetical protein
MDLGHQGPDPVFLQEACSNLSQDLQQSLDRERMLYTRVVALEAECQRMAGEQAELLATIDDLTTAAARADGVATIAPSPAFTPGGERMPSVAAMPVLAPVAAIAAPPSPASRPQPLMVVPPPANRLRAASAPRPAVAPRPPRMSRRCTWHADWDDPPDEQDEEILEQLNTAWYARPATWVALVTLTVVAVALLGR